MRSSARRVLGPIGAVALVLSGLAVAPSGSIAAAPRLGDRGDQPNAASSALVPVPGAKPAAPAEAKDKGGADDIVGGTATSSAPFFVALKPRGRRESFCGGTLISSTVVLTAAHCLKDVTASDLRVVIGAPSWDDEASGDVRTVKSITIHPRYSSPQGAPSGFDGALLRLSRPSTRTWARLAGPSERAAAENGVRAYGHGYTADGGTTQSRQLLQVDMRAAPDDLMRYGSFKPLTMIGAYFYEGRRRGTCQGDSGGPLVVSPPGFQPALVGATSWGVGCARYGKPSVYAKYTEGPLRDWVERLVQRPGNDDFPGTAIGSAQGLVYGTNKDAVSQSGEPVVGDLEPVTSVWWSWTAPETGWTTMSTRRTSFDTTLKVFTGDALDALTTLGSSDDANGSRQSEVGFQATAGTTYRIAVDGYQGAYGDIELEWTQNAPFNDDFHNPAYLSGAAGQVSQNTARSSAEPGETGHVEGGVPYRSVWFQWTAPETGRATINTSRSDYDTILAAYQGDDIGLLDRIASHDGAVPPQSKIDFDVVAGQIYRIVVDGFRADGDLVLQWSTNPPANDDFADPTVLSGRAGTVPATSVRATGEPGEPGDHGGAFSDGSVWFSWTAPGSGTTSVGVVNYAGRGLTPGLEVYRARGSRS